MIGSRVARLLSNHSFVDGVVSRRRRSVVNELLAPPGYKIIRAVGAGASGATVYLARQDSLSRFTALKYLPVDPASEAELASRFLSEARSLAGVRSKSIVRVYDFADTTDGLWLAMQFVPGPTLLRVMNEPGWVSPGLSVQWIVEIADALSAAHTASIVHQDVKPANVMLAADGTCKLTDFGIASLLREGTRVRMVRKAVEAAVARGPAGTPAYMSPEQVRGEGAIDGRSDLYSLGVIAYQLLVGRHPFAEAADDAHAMMEAQLHGEPPKPRSVKPGFPRAVARCLLKAIAKDPRRRQRDVASFSADLAKAADKAWPRWRLAAMPPALVDQIERVIGWPDPVNPSDLNVSVAQSDSFETTDSVADVSGLGPAQADPQSAKSRTGRIS